MAFFIILVIFMFCVGFIWKLIKEKLHLLHPNFLVNLQTEIAQKILDMRLKLEQSLRLAGFTGRIGGFPLVPERAVPEQVNTNDFNNSLNATSTSNRQESNATPLKSTVGLESVRSRKTAKVNLLKTRRFFTARKAKDELIESEKALILEDIVLDTLLCTNCERYLSVLPIKIYADETVKCGRCCKESDGGTVSYLYENIANSCLFKCVNRYEQCTKLLTVSEVAQHERECLAGDYRCPKCEEDPFFGTGYELLRHYKIKHSTSILTTNKFFVDLSAVPSKERYLHTKNDIIFFILVEVLTGENLGKTLYLSVISLTLHRNIKQQFDLKFIGEPVTRMQTETKTCCSLETFRCDYFKVQIHSDFERVKCQANIDIPAEESNGSLEIPRLFKKPESTPVSAASIQTVPIGEISSVELTGRFTMEYPDYRLTPCGTALFKRGGDRIELTCSVCMCFTGSNVFSCPNDKHILCWDCRAEDCKCYIRVSGAGSWNASVSTMNELLLLPCRWNCGKKFPGDGLRTHEAKCLCTALVKSNSSH